MTPTILDTIVAATRQAVAERKQSAPAGELKRRLKTAVPPRDFAAAIRGESIRIIAEVKRASPSRGLLAPSLDVPSLVRSYAGGGAAALSVLTENRFFKGSHADLAAAKKTVGLPVLCKDFILELYQVEEARASGADAILLIAAILDEAELRGLLRTATDLGMTALVETHNAEEVRKALAAGARVIGINNRNLADFTVDIEATLRLRPLVPESLTVVSESGIHTSEDVARLRLAGVDAVLVGEALVVAPDPAARIKELLSRGRVLKGQPCRRPLESIGI